MCAEVTEVYDTMSCLPIVSDRAAIEGSKYFELGWQPHEFLTRNTCTLHIHIYTIAARQCLMLSHCG